jgi:hypothetical protein
MHRLPLTRRLSSSLRFLEVAALAAALLLPAAKARAEGEGHLTVPAGFRSQVVLDLPTNRYLGGLLALPGGGLVLYDGLAVVLLREDGSAPETLFAPATAPVFGSFLKLGPDGSIYFGETHPGETPHAIYRIPFDGVSAGPAQVLDTLRFNYDLAFDGAGRGFISSLDAGNENRIFLLDSDPQSPDDPVVTGIPGFSGPLAFHSGRFYYATAQIPDLDHQNQVVYFTAEEMEAGIGAGRETDFSLATENQVLWEGMNEYFNILFAGDDLLASDSIAGVINRIHPDGAVEPYGTSVLPNGASASISYMSLRSGKKEFRAGAGPEGGALYASLSDFSTFNELVVVTPELWFRRGQINGDPAIDIGDPVALLDYLFQGGTAPEPQVAGDINDDGLVDLSDAIYLLSYLFTGGPQPPEPFLVEGPDPTP